MISAKLIEFSFFFFVFFFFACHIGCNSQQTGGATTSSCVVMCRERKPTVKATPAVCPEFRDAGWTCQLLDVFPPCPQTSNSLCTVVHSIRSLCFCFKLSRFVAFIFFFSFFFFFFPYSLSQVYTVLYMLLTVARNQAKHAQQQWHYVKC